MILIKNPDLKEFINNEITHRQEYHQSELNKLRSWKSSLKNGKRFCTTLSKNVIKITKSTVCRLTHRRDDLRIYLVYPVVGRRM
jgi:hypothetical protein